MNHQAKIFDPDGLLSDVEITLADGPLARPARVGFLAGMLSTWTLGPGVKPTAAESDAFRRIARAAVAEASGHARPAR